MEGDPGQDERSASCCASSAGGVVLRHENEALVDEVPIPETCDEAHAAIQHPNGQGARPPTANCLLDNVFPQGAVGSNNDAMGAIIAILNGQGAWEVLLAFFWMTALDMIAGLVDEFLHEYFPLICRHPLELKDSLDALVDALRMFDDPHIRFLAHLRVLYSIWRMPDILTSFPYCSSWFVHLHVRGDSRKSCFGKRCSI